MYSNGAEPGRPRAALAVRCSAALRCVLDRLGERGCLRLPESSSMQLGWPVWSTPEFSPVS